MVGAARFELATSRSQSERTTRLCYAPFDERIIYTNNAPLASQN